MDPSRRLGPAALAVALIAGCGASPPEATRPLPVAGAPPSSPYAGPLDAQGGASVAIDRTGAAGLALECDGDLGAGGPGIYDSGLASVESSPEDALDDYLVEEGLRFDVPSTGYRVEREDPGRVLLSWDVDGRTKVAFVVADSVRDTGEDVGWGVETWARCDHAELPEEVTEALGIGIWTDRTGHRASTREIRSYQGPEHCDWQDVTFLSVGPKESVPQYVRNPGELTPYLRTAYDENAELPAGAEDTGYRRDGRELWLVPEGEAAYLVSEEDPSDVERWPAAKEYIGCA